VRSMIAGNDSNDQMRQPLLSIVTPTRGDVSDDWLDLYFQIAGDVEFILVYPPGGPVCARDDPRLRIIVSPFPGELIQRLIGLLNASGEYVLALDDDDLAHPDIAQVAKAYFARFPDSWVLRVYVENLWYTDQAQITRPWEDIPNAAELESWGEGTDR